MNENIIKMHTGRIYDPGDPEILGDQQGCQEILYDFNQTRPSEHEKRNELMKKMFAEVGEGVYIERPLYANWGGHFVKLGSHVYMNYGCTLVDDTEITIGDHTEFGPNVIISTAGHPLSAEPRSRGLQYNKPVHIGKNVWLGAGVIVMPGVTIGDNTVVGAGSVVTRDLPANVVAYGSPAKPVKSVEDEDRHSIY